MSAKDLDHAWDAAEQEGRPSLVRLSSGDYRAWIIRHGKQPLIGIADAPAAALRGALAEKSLLDDAPS